MAGAGLPPLQLSGGPSQAGADATSSAAVTTGDFTFNKKQEPWVEIAKTAAPFLILGFVFWMIKRK